MPRNFLLISSALAFFIVSCATADQKIPTIANDFCNCFSSMETSLSKDAKDILVKAANAEDPETTLTNALNELDEEKKNAVAQEMMAFQDAQDPSSELNKCIKKLEKKYEDERTRD